MMQRIAGIVVAAATLGTLAATPPPPKLSASEHDVATYVHGHTTGLALVGLLLAVAAVAVALAFPRPEALTVTAPALVGGVLMAALVHLPQSTGDDVLRAGYVTATEVAYVAPLLGGAVLVLLVSRHVLSLAVAALCAGAGAVALLSTDAGAAGAAFAARLLLAIWCGVVSWRRAS